MQSKYTIDDQTFIGYYAQPDKPSDHAVLIAPNWCGCGQFFHEKAEEFAKLGFHGFAVDMYGNGQLGHNDEENNALMQPLLIDRPLLQKRILACYQHVKTLTGVTKVSIMGYCFGGLVALDLARSGVKLHSTISIHGFLSAAPDHKSVPIQSKVLALHGAKDPMVLDDQLDAFKKEMSDHDIDWQLHIFGDAYHSFATPNGDDLATGKLYSPKADHRTMIMILESLE